MSEKVCIIFPDEKCQATQHIVTEKTFKLDAGILMSQRCTACQIGKYRRMK